MPRSQGRRRGAEATAGGAVFVSWARENGRTTDLGERLAIPVRFVQRHRDRPVIARYAGQFTATLRGLRRARPATVVLMLPPFPLLLAGLIHALRTDAAIVADLHTGAFLNPRWAWSTALALRLLRPHTVVVTNEHLAERCRQAGIRSVLVLHDPLAVREAPPLQHARPQVVCPVSYANDEPIEAMLEAARQTSELDWVLTGRAPAEVRRAAPANLRFAGWLDDAAFENLLAEADVVVALTTRPHTMQRAGYEALMWGKPLVTSEFPVLSEFFGEAAVTVEPHAAAIASGVRDAVERSSELQSAARRVLDERIREQDAALAALREIIRS